MSEFLGADELNVKALLAAARARPPYEGLIVKRDVDYSAVVTLETHQLELPGVSLDVGPLRTYPYGPVGAHLLRLRRARSRRPSSAACPATAWAT